MSVFSNTADPETPGLISHTARQCCLETGGGDCLWSSHTLAKLVRSQFKIA